MIGENRLTELNRTVTKGNRRGRASKSQLISSRLGQPMVQFRGEGIDIGWAYVAIHARIEKAAAIGIDGVTADLNQKRLHRGNIVLLRCDADHFAERHAKIERRPPWPVRDHGI